MQSFFSLFEFFCFGFFSLDTEWQLRKRNNIESIGTKALFPWYLLPLREINLILTKFTQEESPLIINICPDLIGSHY